jgi:MYXO-CTERM domain-containing protein
VLGDPGPAGQDNLSLTVNFSQDLSAVVLDFATSDFITPSPLTLTAYENSTLVGSNTLRGQFLPGFTFPEGEIAFDGGTFNQIVISSTATDFGVDNINVITATAAPEPATGTFLGAGLLALGILAVRRRSARRATIQ